MKIGIIGLGYVGLPLALSFSKKYKVNAFDINKDKVLELRSGLDRTGEISNKDLKKLKKINFSYLISDLSNCDVYIIAVPTPVTKKNRPDLKNLINACILVSKVLKKKSIVIFESTVYPGVTEDVCVPILEKYSKLRFNKDFYCGYSPERINPGDKKYNINNIVKLTSGSTIKTALTVDKLYKSIIKSGTFMTSSIKVAEAAKSIENAQRDINIAFVNELKIIFDKMGLNIFEILKAARTKWNFLNFEPGLVGGHCIGVDPYYLSFISQKYNHNPKVILSGRKINNQFHNHLINDFIKKFKSSCYRKKILILGFTFKENCKDHRNTKIFDLYKGLLRKGFIVDIYDPHVDRKEVLQQYNVKILKSLNKNKYDGIFIAVKHRYFQKMGIKRIKDLCKKKHLIYDFKNLFTLS